MSWGVKTSMSQLSDFLISNHKYLDHILSVHTISKEQYEIGRDKIKNVDQNMDIIKYGDDKGVDVCLYMWILNLYSELEIERFVRYYTIMLKKNGLLNYIVKDYLELKKILCNEVMMLTFILSIQYFFL